MDPLGHDGPPDGQYQHITVDPLITSIPSSDPISSYLPVVGSPLTDTNLPTTHTVSSFSDTIDPASTIAVPPEVAHHSDPRHMDISPVEVVHQPALHHDPVPPPGSIAAFQPPLRDSFPTEQAFDVPRPSQSSPAATSVSSFTSHSSSPAIPGLSPAYTSNHSASIASAMDNMGIPGRSRSGSAASPCRFVGSSSDLTFPSVTSTGTPTSNKGSGFRLQLNEYDASPPAEEVQSPDIAAPPMMLVDNVLKESVL